MPTVELQISALPAHVRTARLVAAALARRLGLDAATIDEVKLAVGEACTRAVGLHVSSHTGAPVVVQFQDDDDILEIRVFDSGYADRTPDDSPAGADDLAAAVAQPNAEVPDPDQIVEVAGLTGRLGLAVIAGLVDDVSVVPRSSGAETGSVVTMRWPIVTFF